MDRAPPARTAVGTAAHPSADAAVLSGPDLRSVRAECARSMDARLRTDTPAPLAVALSGGGDSVALLALAAQWARRHDRRVLALTVDHGLQPESAAWSQYAADTARRSGAEHRVLPWLGDKPTAGLSAAARRARHALLAQAAREAGASVILMGHTADDRLEGDQMRAQGTPLGELRVWSPSPVWPEGRGVFLLRPLLDVRRATLRSWLVEQGLSWIDDPANADPVLTRARARLKLAGAADPPPAGAPRPSSLLDTAEVTFDGRVVIARQALADARDARRFTAVALACASGGEGRVRSDRVEALLARISAGPCAATLGGARVESDSDAVVFSRELGRSGAVRQGAVWDGRFEASPQTGELFPLRGRLARLPPEQRRALATVPVPARGALPALVAEGRVTCPLLDPASPVKLTPLAGPRLRAALGGIVSEP